jgi:hypothetical protein
MDVATWRLYFSEGSWRLDSLLPSSIVLVPPLRDGRPSSLDFSYEHRAISYELLSQCALRHASSPYVTYAQYELRHLNLLLKAPK